MHDGRASWSPALVERVRRDYGLAVLNVKRDLGGGYNLNLLAQTDQGDVVIRVYQPWLETARLAALQQVRRYLADRSWPVAASRPTLDGRGFVRVGNRLLEVEGYMPGGSPMKTWPALRAGMPLLARLHDTLASMSAPAAACAPPFANYLAVDEIVDVAETAGESIAAWGLTETERQYLRSALQLAERLSGRGTFAMPSQLVHGDFWDNNVLLDGERLVLLADFDFVGVRPRIDDLALTLFFANEEAGRQDRSAERVGRLRAVVDAYDRALERPLSDEERADLLYAMARSPLTFLRDLAANGVAGRAELSCQRGPAYRWALEVLDSPVWLEAFS